MQFLEKTSKSYQVVLLALEATNKLAWESSWEIHSPGSPSGPADQPTSLGGLTNGTTAVTVVPGPLNATQQIRVRSFQLSNLDTGAATVLWQKTDSATAVTRTLMQVVLQTLESMVYDENGWTFYDSSGNIKTTNTAAANNAQSVAVSGWHRRVNRPVRGDVGWSRQFDRGLGWLDQLRVGVERHLGGARREHGEFGGDLRGARGVDVDLGGVGDFRRAVGCHLGGARGIGRAVRRPVLRLTGGGFYAVPR